MESNTNNKIDINCPIGLYAMVVPITLQSGHTYDAVSILMQFKTKYNTLVLDEIGSITCANSRDECKFDPQKQQPSLIVRKLIERTPSDSENNLQTIGLPDDFEIIEFIFDKYEDKYCKKYIESSDTSSLHTRDASNNTVAHLAARYGRTETLLALYEKEPSLLNAINSLGYTPAHTAAQHGQTDTVQALLNAEAALFDAKSKHGLEPVHIAAAYGKTETLLAILEAITARDHKILYVAAVYGKTETLIELFEKIPELFHGKSPAHIPALLGKTSTLNDIIEKKPEFLTATDNYGNTLLHAAAQQGRTDTVLAIIEKKPELLNAKNDERSFTPVQVAAQHGHTDTVLELINKQQELKAKMNSIAPPSEKPDPFDTETEKDMPLAHIACIFGQKNTLIKLLQLYPNLLYVRDKFGRTLAHAAAVSNQKDILLALQKRAPNLLYVTDSDGRTSAHNAARYATKDTLLALLNQEPSLLRVKMKSTKNDFTLTHIAAHHGKSENVKALLDRYPELFEETDKCGYTPAHIAALYCETSIFQAIIKKKPELLKLINKNGETLAHMAAQRVVEQHGETDNLLVLYNEYPELLNVRDNNGRTPVDIAAEKSNTGALKKLFEANPQLSDGMELNYSEDVNKIIRAAQEKTNQTQHSSNLFQKNPGSTQGANPTNKRGLSKITGPGSDPNDNSGSKRCKRQ